jgi:RNase adaptor protein for sRNA GlmZ degradation
LTGLDKPVADYLGALPEVQQMQLDIQQFLERWLPLLARDHRSYVTVGIGCTGGQHRSVFLVEALASISRSGGPPCAATAHWIFATNSSRSLSSFWPRTPSPIS